RLNGGRAERNIDDHSSNKALAVRWQTCARFSWKKPGLERPPGGDGAWRKRSGQPEQGSDGFSPRYMVSGCSAASSGNPCPGTSASFSTATGAMAAIST